MVPGMIVRARGGSVISITASADAPHHAAFGGGVSGFSRSLAMELGQYRIRVNEILVPAGASGEHDDVTGVALFLASDLSAFVTGTSIRADGTFGGHG
jgi:NAD(P)-dependent dehydrogenase (short-subunit alcohol dehydrogenase family)